MKNIKTYPVDFKFRNGVNIDEKQINEWITKSIHEAKIVLRATGQRRYHTSISSGNTIVFIEFYHEQEDEYSIFINVAKDYYRMDIINYDVQLNDDVFTVDY